MVLKELGNQLQNLRKPAFGGIMERTKGGDVNRNPPEGGVALPLGSRLRTWLSLCRSGESRKRVLCGILVYCNSRGMTPTCGV